MRDGKIIVRPSTAPRGRARDEGYFFVPSEKSSSPRAGAKRLSRGALWSCSMLLAALLLAHPALAQKNYGPGVTDTSIKIGQTQPYSGFGSAYSTIGKASAAYFTMVNDQGGINGRKIDFLSRDDGFNPGKTVEQTRKLVEEENVLAIFDSVGTPTNLAVQKYLNQRGIPQLFAGSGATRWADPEHFPWTIGWQPAYRTEGRVYGRYIMEAKPNGKIGILYQDDDYGHDYINGIRDILGAKTDKMLVALQTYAPTDPTVDSQLVFLAASGADVFVDISQPKFTAMAIRKAWDLGWHPLHIVNSVSTSVDQVLRPAGFDKATAANRRDLSEGPDRSGLEGRCRPRRLSRVHEEVRSRRQARGRAQRLRLFGGADSGRGVEAMRQRSQPRESDETGDPSPRPAAHAVAGREDRDEPNRLSRYQGHAARPLQRHHVAALRRHRLGRVTEPYCLRNAIAASHARAATAAS